jgi:hypothetical protein
MPKGCHEGHVRGEKHPFAKLSPALVKYILASDEPSHALAMRLEVSRGAIEDVRQRRTWRHITC